MPKSKARALIAIAYLMTATTATGLFYGFFLVLANAQESELIAPFVVGGIAAVVGIGCTFFAIIKRAGGAGEHVLFDTWFPLFMSAVPIAGPFIALWSSYKLLRGRMSGATITTTSGSSRSRRSYDGFSLHGAGIPGGLILLMIASVQPMIAFVVISGPDLASNIGIKPVTNTWDGKESLNCNSPQRYIIQQTKVDCDRIYLNKGCHLEVRDCEMNLVKAISLNDDASLSIIGGKLTSKATLLSAGEEAQITLENVDLKGHDGFFLDDNAQLNISGGRLISERYGLNLSDKAHAEVKDVVIQAPYSVDIEDKASVFLSGGSIHGKTAILAEDDAIVTLKKVDYLGKVRTKQRGLIHELAEGQSPEAILDMARNRKERVAKYQIEACKGLIECYQKNGIKGAISGKLTMVVGQNGKVRKVKRKRLKGTTLAVRQCVDQWLEEKTIPNFAGPTGTMYCKYSGTVTPVSRMLDVSSTFVPDKTSGVHLEKVE